MSEFIFPIIGKIIKAKIALILRRLAGAKCGEAANKTNGKFTAISVEFYQGCFVEPQECVHTFWRLGISKGNSFCTQLCLQSVVCYTHLPTAVQNRTAADMGGTDLHSRESASDL